MALDLLLECRKCRWLSGSIYLNLERGLLSFIQLLNDRDMCKGAGASLAFEIELVVGYNSSPRGVHREV